MANRIYKQVESSNGGRKEDAMSHLLGISRPGEEISVVVPVERDVQNVGVVVEDLLQSVPMVDVLKYKISVDRPINCRHVMPNIQS